MEDNNRVWYIYLLSDPRTFKPRYIGWSYDVSRRLKKHMAMCNRERTHKANWLRSLHTDNLVPIVSILEEGIDDWAACEIKWIKYYKDIGESLTNGTVGGEGSTGRILSEDSRRRMGIRPPITEETKRKISNTTKGRVHSDEAIRKSAETRTGQKRSDEFKLKMRQIKLGTKTTEETKEKQRIIHTGRVHTEESKQKMRESATGRKRSPESILKWKETMRKKRECVEIGNSKDEVADLTEQVHNLLEWCQELELKITQLKNSTVEESY